MPAEETSEGIELTEPPSEPEPSPEVAIKVAPESTTQPRRFSNIAVERDSILALFNEEAYPDGDGDVIKACLGSGLSYEDMVLVVFRTKDTIFSCDVQVAGPKLFEMIDRDKNQMLSPEEFMLAQVTKSHLCWLAVVRRVCFYLFIDALHPWSVLTTIIMNLAFPTHWQGAF